MNERVCHINSLILELQRQCIMPLRLLDVARKKEEFWPEVCSTNDIQFDQPKVRERLNKFPAANGEIKSDLVEMGRFTFGPQPKPPFFPLTPNEPRLGEQRDSRDSSTSSKSSHHGSNSYEGL